MLSTILTLSMLASQAAGHGHAHHGSQAAHAGHARQAEVAERGASVMPFDLERTTHAFRPLADGGVQTVTSNDGDARQVELIREHLRLEAAAFARGDFASPAAIHGTDMPGLAELSAGASRMRVAYEDADTGGRLRFMTSDAGLVAALHRWFAAQRSDHGRHAAPK